MNMEKLFFALNYLVAIMKNKRKELEEKRQEYLRLADEAEQNGKLDQCIEWLKKAMQILLYLSKGGSDQDSNDH